MEGLHGTLSFRGRLLVWLPRECERVACSNGGSIDETPSSCSGIALMPALELLRSLKPQTGAPLLAGGGRAFIDEYVRETVGS